MVVLYKSTRMSDVPLLALQLISLTGLPELFAPAAIHHPPTRMPDHQRAREGRQSRSKYVLKQNRLKFREFRETNLAASEVADRNPP
jgi:hypothetical protein